MLRIIIFIFTLSYSFHSFAKEEQDKNFFDTFITNNKEFHNLLTLRSERVFRLTHPDCVSDITFLRTPPTVLLPPAKRPEIKIMPDVENTKNKQKAEQIPKVEIVGHTQVKDQPKETEQDKKAPSPIYGQWIERVHTKGCDKKSLINHLTIGYTNATPIVLPLTNGNTRLDPIDQPFAEHAIADRLKKLERPCETPPFIIDSSVIGYRTKDGGSIQNEDAGFGWFERWDIRACDTRYKTNIAILPDPNTRYRYIARLEKY